MKYSEDHKCPKCGGTASTEFVPCALGRKTCLILSTVAMQMKEVLRDKTVISCGNCRRKIRIIYTYRCFYCGIIYCRRCAKNHFGKEIKE